MFKMIEDSLRIYNSYQYLNTRCYSCGSKEHIALHCPTIHGRYNKSKVIQNYIKAEQDFKRNFKRRDRTRFHVLKSLDQLQEAASQIQISYQHELEFDEEIIYYDENQFSETDEVLDKNLYDPQPIVYYDDEGMFKVFNPDDNIFLKKTHKKSITKTSQEKKKPNEIDQFMIKNYDPYYKNISIDRVQNFEVYFPNHNITRLMIDFEKRRCEKILQMRVGTKATHIIPILVKSFKMHERRKANQQNPNGSLSNENEPTNKSPTLRSPNLAPRKDIDPKKVQEIRRKSVGVNPEDIVAYSSGTDNHVKQQFSMTNLNSGLRMRRDSSLKINNNPSQFKAMSRKDSDISRSILLRSASEIESEPDSDEGSAAFSGSLKSKIQLEPADSREISPGTARFRTPRSDSPPPDKKQKKPSSKGNVGNIDTEDAMEYKRRGSQTFKNGSGDDKGPLFINFTQRMMKMTSKLEENRSPSHSNKSFRLSNPSTPKSGVIAQHKPRKSLFSEEHLATVLLKERVNEEKRKGTVLKRSNSSDKLKEVQKVIEKWGLTQIVKEVLKKQDQ